MFLLKSLYVYVMLSDEHIHVAMTVCWLIWTAEVSACLQFLAHFSVFSYSHIMYCTCVQILNQAC